MHRVVLLASTFAWVVSAATILVDDASLSTPGTVVWTADNEYVLLSTVLVDSGITLVIEPGTVVRGSPGDAENPPGALIVCRGAEIQVSGTMDDPVLFTAEADDIGDPFDLGPGARGLWGGVAILGDAPLCVPGGEDFLEWVQPGDPRAAFGGNDEAGNSGHVSYVSIRHCGSVGGTSGNEYNGLTLGAVGSSTNIDHVEVAAALDDAFAWVGGTVNCRYLVSAFCGDDDFDFDDCYRGKGQFYFAIKGASGTTDHSGEVDGTSDPQGHPGVFSEPVVYNATLLGTGRTGGGSQDHDRAFVFRDGAAGQWRNSIFGQTDGYFAEIEHEGADDSWDRLMADTLKIRNNIVWDFSAGAAWADLVPDVSTHPRLVPFNVITDPHLLGVSRAVMNPWLDPRPAPGSPACDPSLIAAPSGPFFEQASYLGAFGPFEQWLGHWTALHEWGIANSLPESDVDSAEIPIESDTEGNEKLVNAEWWQEGYGHLRSLASQAMIQCSDGGFLLSGIVDSAGIEYDDGDIFLMKTDPGGSILWSNTFDMPEVQKAHALLELPPAAHSPLPRYCIVGETGPRDSLCRDILLVVTDSDGKRVFETTIGHAGDDVAYDALHVGGDTLLLAGHTNSFGRHGDVYIVGYELSSQSIVFADAVDDGGWEEARALCGHDRWYYLVGSAKDADRREQEGLLIRLRDDMTLDRLQRRGSETGGVRFHAVAVASPTASGLAVAGELSASSEAWEWEDDVYCAGLDSNGVLLWEERVGLTDRETAADIVFRDGLWVVGGTRDRSFGSEDAWLVALGESGGMKWRKTFGSDRPEAACAVVRTLDGGIAFSGVSKAPTGGPLGGNDESFLVVFYPEGRD